MSDLNPSILTDQITTDGQAKYCNARPVEIFKALTAYAGTSIRPFYPGAATAARIGYIDLAYMSLTTALHRLCVVSGGTIHASQDTVGTLVLAYTERPKYDKPTA